MPTTEIRVGVIGRGFGQEVAAAFDDTEGCRVVDLVSPRDEGSVAKLCRRSGVDLISIHSPPFLHLDNVRQAIEGGHSVLCDKPFGRNVEESREMFRLAEESGAMNFINFEARFDAGRHRLRSLVQQGSVGTPCHFQSTYIFNTSRFPLRPFGWLFDLELGGGWMRSIGAHQTDFFRWTFGDIAASTGQVYTLIGERPDSEGVVHRCSADDGFTMHLQSSAGVTGVIDSTFAAATNLVPRSIVIGDEATIEVTGDGHLVRYAETGSVEDLTADVDETNDPGRSRLRQNMADFAVAVRDSLRRGAPMPDVPTFADGLACMAAIDQVRKH